MTIDEAAHLPSGIYIWERGRFDLYRVNPPLIRAIAAAPAFLGGAETDWRSYDSKLRRPEWQVRSDFVAANGTSWFRWFRYARWTLIPLTILGGVVCYLWANELYGHAAGHLALALWCFSPNVLAWGSTIVPDLGAAAMAILAGWLFFRWLKRPAWFRACCAGLALGLAELTKMTLVVFFLLWPLLWLVWRGLQRPDAATTEHEAQTRTDGEASFGLMSQLGQLAAMIVLALHVLNTGYLFDGSFERLGGYKFESQLLAGEHSIVNRGFGGNRFANSVFAEIPVPLPRDYVLGIDSQRVDFERQMWSYLNGTWQNGGWWYYYIFALCLKVPLGTWLIAVLAATTTVLFSRYRRAWRDEIILLSPALVVLLLVSSQTGINHYPRYLLPAFPFVFVWCSKVAMALRYGHKVIIGLAAAGLIWSIGSTLWSFPHTMSYFNELAGGPSGGHRYLLGGNVDWGQDLIYLKEWCDTHPEARPIKCSLYSLIRPDAYGLEALESEVADHRLPPGWYAISVNVLFGRSKRFEWLLNEQQPIDKAGYSIWIYYVDTAAETHIPVSESSPSAAF